MTALDITLPMFGERVFWFTRNRNTIRRGWRETRSVLLQAVAAKREERTHEK